MKRARLAALMTGLAAALTLTACGVPPTGVIGAGEPAHGLSSADPGTPLTPTIVPLYFLRDGELSAYGRKTTVPVNVENAVRLLFAGPTLDEAAKITTELPRVKGALEVAAGADAVEVRLPKGVSPLSHRAMMQLACTVSRVGTSLTSVPNTADVGGSGGFAASPDTKAEYKVYGTVRVHGAGWTLTQAADSCPDA
ncbi:hypothetical protein PV417_13200 [Streptomyces sp. ME19-03-3]|nr:hypothetical protein [Streptomyces sp. ME19-03-3]